MNTYFNRIAIALVALGLGSGCHRGRVESGPEPQTINALVVHANELPFEVISSGAIEAIEKADTAFMVPGRVVSVDAEDGALVRKGQLLARLDPADY